MQVNPIIEELLEIYPDLGPGDFNPFLEDLKIECSRLKQELKVGLEDKISKLLSVDNLEGAMEQVEEVLNKFYAIKYLIDSRLPKEKPANGTEKKKPMIGTEKEIDHTDLFNTLFFHAFRDMYCKREKVRMEDLRLAEMDSKIVAEPHRFSPRSEFMLFLIKKVQRDWHIMNALDESKDRLVAKCISKYEEDSFAACIAHVRDGKLKEAVELLYETINSQKQLDIINRGRVYNRVLQEAIGNQGSGVQCQGVDGDQLQILAEDPVNFFVDLFLQDKGFMQHLTFGWMEEHDYPSLILCVWECYKKQNIDVSKLCTRNRSDLGVQPEDPLQYAFQTVATIAGCRMDIIEELLFQEWPHLDINKPYRGVTPLHLAVYKGHDDLFKFLLKRRELDINVRTAPEKDKNRWKLPQYQTALHIATAQGHATMVYFLCYGDHPHQKLIRCHEEDANNITALDIVYAKLKANQDGPCDQHRKQSCLACSAQYEDIERILLSIADVQKGIDRLYRNRQVHVDAANTILVGAALIASVAFAGWLQPPLGYAQYYDFPTPPPAPPGTYDSYLRVEGNVGIQVFAIFNSLSFFFAIATVIVGADSAFPMHDYRYIGDVVVTMKQLLRRAIMLLIISVVCVLGAFGSAAVVILPPHLYFRKHLVFTIFIGGCVCSVVLWQLLSRHSKGARQLNAYIIHVISNYTNIF